MKIVIVTDDNSGFKKDEIKGLPIYILRMPILIDGECFFEDENLDEDTFYNKQKTCDKVCTSQPSPGEIMKVWDLLLKEYDAILHIPMSSGLSATCETAKALAENYDGKVVVVDNHRISVTLKRSIYNAINLIKDGKTPEEIKDILENGISATSIYIMVDTLTYLKKGGRVTAAGAAIANTLHIKPILAINGYKLDAKAKAIGTKNAKRMMIQLIHHDLDTKFKGIPIEDLEFGMAYTHNLDDALEFKEEFIKEFNPKNFIMNPLSLSIAVHIGPGSLAVTISKIVK